MKNSPLQPLLDQVTLIYEEEKQLAQYYHDLQTNLRDGLKVDSLLHDAEENKTHCERLEGLIEILVKNLNREITPAETKKCFQNCFELLQRFRYKHSTYNYKNISKGHDQYQRAS